MSDPAPHLNWDQREAEWNYLDRRNEDWRGFWRWMRCWWFGHLDRTSPIVAGCGEPYCRYCGLGSQRQDPRRRIRAIAFSVGFGLLCGAVAYGIGMAVR